MRLRLLQGLALLSTGLLAGAFGYGAVNLAPTFDAAPLAMRLSFHAELMKMNGITMQAAMAASTLSCLAGPPDERPRTTARRYGGEAISTPAATRVVHDARRVDCTGTTP